MPSESSLSDQMLVSRTTARKVLKALEARGIIASEGRVKIVRNVPTETDQFPDEETLATSQQIEKRFMEWMLRGDTKPGALINELELARQFGVGTTSIREFLNRFSRFGLVEKRPNSGWLFKGFTKAFGLELFEIRELFELRSALAFARQPKEAPIWNKLRLLEREHHALLDRIETNFHDFSDLDNRFHRLINEGAPNRFIDDFYDIITFIFHYHYQWNKRDEKQRNALAIREHLAYIEALFSQSENAVQSACQRHLRSARETLMRALAP